MTVVYGKPETLVIGEQAEIAITLNAKGLALLWNSSLSHSELTPEQAVSLGERLIQIGTKSAQLINEQTQYDQHQALSAEYHMNRLESILRSDPPR